MGRPGLKNLIFYHPSQSPGELAARQSWAPPRVSDAVAWGGAENLHFEQVPLGGWCAQFRDHSGRATALGAGWRGLATWETHVPIRKRLQVITRRRTR